MLVAPPASSCFSRAITSVRCAEQRGGVVLDAVGQLVARQVADHAHHALAGLPGRGALALAVDHLQRAGGRHHPGIVGAADPLAFLAEDGDALDDLVDLGKLVEQQVVALARGAADAVVAAGGQPERRVRALQRLGLDHDVVVLPALAVMAEPALAGPRLADDLHRLVEALGGLRHGNAEAVELGLAVALADAEIDPPAAQEIERGDLLGHQHRIVPGQHDHRRAEADVPGLGRKIRQHGHRGRHLAMTGEVMLDHEELPEAQAVGFDHILDEALVALAVLKTDTAPGSRSAEQSKLHVASLRAASIIRTPDKKTLGKPRCSGANCRP